MKTTLPLSPEFNKSTRAGKVLLIDFNDSFSFNIASELLQYGVNVEVISFFKIKANLEAFIIKNKYQVIILGPGPGHPNDYFDPSQFIKKLLRKNIFVMGICLGHQMICMTQGFTLTKSNKPIHGSSEEVHFPKSFLGIDITIKVQKYNSLAIIDKGLNSLSDGNILKNSDGEIIAVYSDKLLSYQFHPESIGTSCRKHLFQPLLDFLYNKADED